MTSADPTLIDAAQALLDAINAGRMLLPDSNVTVALRAALAAASPPAPADDNDALGRYVSRPQTVEAIRWDGTVPRSTEATEWAPGKVRLSDAYDLELLAGKDGAQEWVPVPVGHWLVRQPGDLSDIWPVDPDYFAAKYQPEAPNV